MALGDGQRESFKVGCEGTVDGSVINESEIKELIDIMKGTTEFRLSWLIEVFVGDPEVKHCFENFCTNQEACGYSLSDRFKLDTFSDVLESYKHFAEGEKYVACISVAIEKVKGVIRVKNMEA